MRTKLSFALTAAMWLLSAGTVHAQTPLTTAFTYQGELANAGTPATGTYDIRYRLYDAATGGTQIGSTLCSDNLAVNAGRFGVSLDFGGVFTGQKQFLEIEVRQDAGLDCSDASGYTVLAPRQELTATPNATFAQTAATAATATTATTAANAASLNGQSPSFYQNAANLTGTLADARLSSNVARLNGNQTFTGQTSFSNPANTFSGIFSGNGAGLLNLNGANIAAGTITRSRVGADVESVLSQWTSVPQPAAPLDAIAWGDNSSGQTNVPALPSGVTYTAVAGGFEHSLALRGTVIPPRLSSPIAVAASSFVGSDAALTNLNAANLTGTLAADRIPSLDASKITTGTLAAAQIPNLDASKIITGALANARTSGTNLNTPSTLVLRDDLGNFSAGTITANLNGNAATATTATNATNATQLNGQPASFYTNAANLTGTLANARTSGTNLNTPSTLVLRDASGNFSAGTITANLNGNAATATTANTANSATTASQLNGQSASFYTNASNMNTGTIGSTVLPVLSWTNSALPDLPINPVAYTTIPGTTQALSMRAGVAIVSWSVSGYSGSANTSFGIRVRAGSNTGPVTNFYFNSGLTHLTISGNAAIPIPASGNTTFSLEMIRTVGSGLFVADARDSLTATVINIGQ